MITRLFKCREGIINASSCLDGPCIVFFTYGIKWFGEQVDGREIERFWLSSENKEKKEKKISISI